MITGTVSVYKQGFGSAFSDMIIKGKNFSESMAGVWENMKEVFLRAVGEMIAKWAVLTAVQMITGIPTASIAKFLNFQMGGVVPGPIGQPALVVAHGGEEFSGVGQRLQRENVNFEIANTINVSGEAGDSAIAKITQAVEEGNMRAIQMAKALYNQGKLLEGETS